MRTVLSEGASEFYSWTMAGRRCKCSFSLESTERFGYSLFSSKKLFVMAPNPSPSWEGLHPPVRFTTLNNDLSASETWTFEIRDSCEQKEPLPLHVPTFPQKWICLYLSQLRHRAVNAGAFIWKGNPPQIQTRLEKASKNLDVIAV